MLKAQRWCLHNPLNGVIIAFVERLPAAYPTERHPFKVFKPKFTPASRPQFGTYVGVSYRARTPESAVAQFFPETPLKATCLPSF